MRITIEADTFEEVVTALRKFQLSATTIQTAPPAAVVVSSKQLVPFPPESPSIQQARALIASRIAADDIRSRTQPKPSRRNSQTVRVRGILTRRNIPSSDVEDYIVNTKECYGDKRVAGFWRGKTPFEIQEDFNTWKSSQTESCLMA